MRKWMMMAAWMMGAAQAWAADAVTVTEAWLRLPPPVADSAAVYMTLRNDSDRAVVFTGARAPGVAKRAMWHATMKRHGTMRMRGMKRLVVPAHGVVRLAPGGQHLMLMGLLRSLRVGERVRLVLDRADGGMVEAEARVRDARRMHGTAHSHGGMH
ncbi:MAG: copper chaperone PCu(A)C [Mariprofundaceae bacterium]